MGLYGRHVLPHCIDFVMRRGQPTDLRREVLEGAQGNVLEVGVGSGLNLPHYGRAVRSVTGVDFSLKLLAMAERRAAGQPFPVELVQAGAERLPFESRRFEAAVSTWSLCSIAGVEAALAEVRRVLKAGGCLHFIEHGLAPEPRVRGWQARLTPIWKRVAGGCHLDRKIDSLIAAAGFRIVALEAAYAEGPHLTSFTYRGIARVS
jgi:ubiquinone/menaquinone biosynthesis C-methylase UbiE